MRGRGLGKSVGEWVRLWRVGALVGLLLSSFAACDGDEAGYAHDARRYDANLPDAAPLDASPPDAAAYDAPPGCEWSSYPGSFTVSSRSDLAPLEGFTHIGMLTIDGCDDCVDLTALECLTEVGGWMAIWGNQALTSLHGLENLAVVRGDVVIGWGDCGVRPWDNQALTSLEGLEGLRTVEGSLFVSGSALTSLDGLNSLESAGSLELFHSALTSLDGLNSLESAGAVLRLHNMPVLADIRGLESLTSVGSLDIDHNAVLPDCEVCALLAQLAEPPESLWIDDNLADSCTPAPNNCP